MVKCFNTTIENLHPDGKEITSAEYSVPYMLAGQFGDIGIAPYTYFPFKQKLGSEKANSQYVCKFISNLFARIGLPLLLKKMWTACMTTQCRFCWQGMK